MTLKEDNFELYQNFLDRESAKRVGRKLSFHGIKNLIKEAPAFDPSFSNSDFYKEYSLKLRASDFKKANEILNRVSEEELARMPGHYYLFNFSNSELMNVLKYEDEWNPFDYRLAFRILNERGQNISDEELEEMQKQRLIELSQPIKSKSIWIFLAYMFAIFLGFIGIFIGSHMAFYKKTLPNGEKVYGYVDSERSHGKAIMIISIISSLIYFFKTLIPQY